MNKCERLELLEFIDQVTFMLDDLTLYLDTHPHCKKGLEAYNNYKALRHDAKKEYEEKFGPLDRYHVNNDNCFDWIDSPWPWEGVCNC